MPNYLSNGKSWRDSSAGYLAAYAEEQKAFVVVCWAKKKWVSDILMQGKGSTDLKFVGTGGPVKFFLAV